MMTAGGTLPAASVEPLMRPIVASINRQS
jgi:hypothetical protein